MRFVTLIPASRLKHRLKLISAAFRDRIRGYDYAFFVGYACSEPSLPKYRDRNILFWSTLSKWICSPPRRCIPLLFIDWGGTVGLGAAGALLCSHLPPDSSAIGTDFPQSTTWQGEQLIEVCCQTDLAVANSFQGGSSIASGVVSIT